MPLIKNFLYQFSQRQQNAPHESGVRFFAFASANICFTCRYLVTYLCFCLLSVILTCLGFGLDLGLGLGLLILILYLYLFIFVYVYSSTFKSWRSIFFVIRLSANARVSRSRFCGLSSQSHSGAEETPIFLSASQ